MTYPRKIRLDMMHVVVVIRNVNRFTPTLAAFVVGFVSPSPLVSVMSFKKKRVAIISGIRPTAVREGLGSVTIPLQYLFLLR